MGLLVISQVTTVAYAHFTDFDDVGHGDCASTDQGSFWLVQGDQTANGCPGHDGDQDHMYGFDGADYLRGLGGADELTGGYWNDDLTGGTGNDVIMDTHGQDTDRVCDGPGNDSIYLRDGDGQDIVYMSDDGVTGETLDVNDGDYIYYLTACPF